MAAADLNAVIVAVVSVLLVVVVVTVAASIAAHAQTDPPLKQMQSGIPISEIRCDDGKALVQKNLRPACVTGATAEVLVQRGWIVVQVNVHAPPPPPPPAVAAPPPDEPKTDKSAPVNDTTEPYAADNGQHVYDPHYLMLDGRITLEAIDPMPNPTGIWMPVTREEAESVVLPRLASGLGDKLMLPAIREYDDQYVYATEMDYEFYATRSSIDDMVTSVRYFVEYQNFAEREDFIRSFMENAGFNISDINVAGDNIVVYGPLKHIRVTTGGGLDKLVTVIHFSGWTNDEPPAGYSISKLEAAKRVHDIVLKHMHLYSNDERCKFELKDFDNDPFSGPLSLHMHAGVPVFEVHAGKCWSSFATVEPQPIAASWMIDGVTGEVAWPREYHKRLVDNWFEQLEVPEWARVKGHD